MAVTCDPEHKFDLALQLGDLKIAYQLAKEAEVQYSVTSVCMTFLCICLLIYLLICTYFT